MQVREYLEKSYEETEGANTVKLAVKALMEVVEAGSKNLEIAVMEKDTGERATSPCAMPGLRSWQISTSGSVHSVGDGDIIVGFQPCHRGPSCSP